MNTKCLFGQCFQSCKPLLQRRLKREVIIAARIDEIQMRTLRRLSSKIDCLRHLALARGLIAGIKTGVLFFIIGKRMLVEQNGHAICCSQIGLQPEACCNEYGGVLCGFCHIGWLIALAGKQHASNQQQQSIIKHLLHISNLKQATKQTAFVFRRKQFA